VKEYRYGQWVFSREELYQSEDPDGTPAAWLNGRQIDSRVLFDGPQFEKHLQT
jgi:hypothetical protein